MNSLRAHSLYAAKKTHIMRKLAVVAVLLLLLFGGRFAYLYAQENITQQGISSLKSAILASAQRCCAIEGAYPASLSYLEENYGLIINHNRYIVSYELFAQNIPPTVTVLPL